MRRLTASVLLAAVMYASAPGAAQTGRVFYHGRATVEFSSPEVKAVAAYEYSRRNHRMPWILIELAVLAKARIAIDRDQITLLTPDERLIRLATHEMYREDQAELTKLLQNAVVSRRPLGLYFNASDVEAIRFFTRPGGTVSDSFVTNEDLVAMGDIFFKNPDGRWPAGEYRLRISHERARAELPIELQ
jgi:hypothetical protein